MKSTLKVFAGFCLSLFGVGLISCSNDTESAVINITPIIAYDTTTVTDDSLSPEEIKMLYKMREANHRISGAEIVTLIDNVIGILDEETGLKSGDGRKVRSITPLVSENSKAVALKSGGESAIEIPDTLAYVVNFEDSLGFAILAADTRVESPILGFFDQGSLIDSTDNPGMVLMLERMENYILGGILETEEQKDSLLNEILEKQEIESGTKAGEAEIRVIGSPVPGKTLAQVTPLLLVEWDQGTPYNNNVGGKCSGDGTAENGKYWAGCVATSVAQIMAYWKYPAKIDNYSFNWNTLNQYTANPTRVGLNMASKYAIDNAPENVKNQIATLFQKIGNGVGMNYGCKGSSAKQDDAISFLKKQGYKADGINEFYPYLAETSLNKKRPLLAEGCAIKKNHKILGITLFATYDGCHSWVIDGYLTKELKYKAQIGMSIYNVVSSVSYFHHNWGWSGSRNGYLESGIFNSNLVPNFPSNTKAGEPYNYQYKIKVVPNIYK